MTNGSAGSEGSSNLFWVSDLTRAGGWIRPRALHLPNSCSFLGRLALLQGRGPGHLNHGVNILNAPPELETCLKALRPQGQIWKISSNKAFSFKNMFVSLWPFCSDFSQSVPFPLLSSHPCKGSETLRSSKRRLEKLHSSRP